jgi:hypothetical protein
VNPTIQQGGLPSSCPGIGEGKTSCLSLTRHSKLNRRCRTQRSISRLLCGGCRRLFAALILARDCWVIPQRHTLDRLPSQPPLAGEGAVAAVPLPDAGDAGRHARRQSPTVLRRSRPPRRQGCVQARPMTSASGHGRQGLDRLPVISGNIRCVYGPRRPSSSRVTSRASSVAG